MKNIKNLLLKIKNNTSVKYFLFLIIMCIALVSIVRPIVQNQLNIEPVSKPSKAKKNLPIYCVNTENKKVGISFDAAWGADDTDELLQVLENNNVKATFFLCGTWVDKYPEEVKKIHSKGHEIGNHSNTHPHVTKISLEENKKEIMSVHNKVKELIGKDIDLYRPPFGEYNDTVLQAAKELGYHTIQWDIETLETKVEVLKAFYFSLFPIYFY